MSNVHRYRRGETNPIQLATSATYPVEIGDLCFRNPADSKTVRPAGSMADQLSAALNRDTFRQHFAGVCLQKIGLQSGEVSFQLHPRPDAAVLATEGEFEFDCDSTVWYPGDLVGVCENAGGTALLPQKVVKVTSYAEAVAVAVPEANCIGVARTTVNVRLFATKFDGGVMTPTSGAASSGTP